MRIYFAGSGTADSIDSSSILFRLGSFYNDPVWIRRNLSIYKDFMLDSGAFTFMSHAQKCGVDFEKYVDQYADFIKELKIKKFFELDIDVVVGIKEVERLRKRLERRTQLQCMPVFHLSRGKQYYIDMCKNYSYVGIGGIVTKEFSKKAHQHFPWFINIAHENECKVHALGLSSLEEHILYHFDSIDITSWLEARFGMIAFFDGTTMHQKNAPAGRRLLIREVSEHNMNEWVKYQKYAVKHL